MSDLLGYQRRVSWFCLCVGVVASGGLYLGLPERWGFAAGLMLGTVAGLVRMRIMAAAILQMMSTMTAGNAHRNLFRHQMVGYVIMAVALFGGFHLGGQDMGWAVLAGLLLPNVVLALDGYLRPEKMDAPGTASGAGADPTPEQASAASASADGTGTGASSSDNEPGAASLTNGEPGAVASMGNGSGAVASVDNKPGTAGQADAGRDETT